jgi:hypothetical protein
VPRSVRTTMTRTTSFAALRPPSPPSPPPPSGPRMFERRKRALSSKNLPTLASQSAATALLRAGKKLASLRPAPRCRRCRRRSLTCFSKL